MPRLRRLVPAPVVRLVTRGLEHMLPLSESWGWDRGLPIDRYYIERFLDEHRADIRGRVLEVKDRLYTSRFGSNVESSDVLDVDPENEEATIRADLGAADAIAGNTFDCFVLTQTLQYVYDVPAALGHVRRILRPGGVLLLTVPVASRVVVEHANLPDYWRFTRRSCDRLLADAFGAQDVAVREYGNLLASLGFLAGLAARDVPRRALDGYDERFPLVVAARAVKR